MSKPMSKPVSNGLHVLTAAAAIAAALTAGTSSTTELALTVTADCETFTVSTLNDTDAAAELTFGRYTLPGVPDGAGDHGLDLVLDPGEPYSRTFHGSSSDPSEPFGDPKLEPGVYSYRLEYTIDGIFRIAEASAGTPAECGIGKVPPRVCRGNAGDYCLAAHTQPTSCNGRVRARMLASITPGPNGETRTGAVFDPTIEIRFYSVTGEPPEPSDTMRRKNLETELVEISSDDGWVPIVSLSRAVDVRLVIVSAWFTEDGMSMKPVRRCVPAPPILEGSR